MNAKALIRKTRDGGELTREEIEFLVRGAVTGTVAPYQLTAWMMAVFFRGITCRETLDLTRAILDSGERLAFAVAPVTADKHSTGGVGDKLSLLVAPLVAAAGVPVPMMSGRTLGHTGGTLDKLESIPGFRTDLDPTEFVTQVEAIGICIAGRIPRLAPADHILYELRDAASIVESIPLITASILGKKAAAGVRALVLDVKVGSGAFMAELDDARRLAEELVSTASRLGMRARAHLTSMEFVLGRTAGNALEVVEAIRALRDCKVDVVIRELTLLLAGSMLELAGRVRSRDEGESMISDLWSAGSGYDRFVAMVRAQGGRVEPMLDPDLLPRSDRVLEVAAPTPGVFRGVRARPAGDWIAEAGGGRLRVDATVDPRVGLEILIDPGASVRGGEATLRLHLPPGDPDPGLMERAATWIEIGAPGPASPIVLGEVGASG